MLVKHVLERGANQIKKALNLSSLGFYLSLETTNLCFFDRFERAVFSAELIHHINLGEEGTLNVMALFLEKKLLW